jgi:uncharacterized protein YdeI (YjbR/CyaY-like superfamily)
MPLSAAGLPQAAVLLQCAPVDTMVAIRTLDVRSRAGWRSWLARHHADTAGIWLVYYKAHVKRAGVSYDDSVAEALCFGWVDSLIRRLDDDRYARKFTPRRADSRWSTANRRRYAELERDGRLAPAGKRRPPTARSGDAPQPSSSAISDVGRALRAASPAAARAFARLAPSHRRAYAAWVGAAKRPETRQRRIRAAATRLVSGQPLGMK